MNRLLSIVGIASTAAYLVAIALLAGDRVAELTQMPLNNLGDFLAGAFGPIAILWLILGFFQQGIELRQNTRALQLQAEELKNSVEQQRQLVEVSRTQVEAELETIRYERMRTIKAAQPHFVFQGVSGRSDGSEGALRVHYETKIKNVGNNATDITFVFDPPMKSQSTEGLPSWSHGETHSLTWLYAEGTAKSEATLCISFFDALGSLGEQHYRLVPTASHPYPMVTVQPLQHAA